MAPEKSSRAVFPICQNVICSKNSLSDRIFWKRELDHQYQFYLATLRAERDARYVIQEHSDLLSRIRNAETRNVELRKEIRLLEKELYVMYQRNAHDSHVIDGLHEADHDATEVELLKPQTRRRTDIATVEGKHEDTLIGLLKSEIALLERKEGEDLELIASLKPLEKQLEKTLEVEKLKNHQQAMKFKRDLEEILHKFQERSINLETIKSQKSSEETWIGEIFSSVFGSEIVDSQVSSTVEDAVSTESSQETESFDVPAEEEILDAEGLGEDFQAKKEEYCEFVALKELLDMKNKVNLQLICDCIRRFSKGVEVLAEEYLSVFGVSTDIEFIKEYLVRLDTMRQKRDAVKVDHDPVQEAHRLDQLSLIYSSLLAEKAFIGKSLSYFTSTLKEDFETHCVILHQTEDLFASSSTE